MQFAFLPWEGGGGVCLIIIYGSGQVVKSLMVV